MTAVPPLLVRVTVTDAVEPVSTFPKASLAGFSASCPSAAVPVPETAKVVLVGEASLVIVTVALKLPAAFGLN